MSLKEYRPGSAFTGVIGRTYDVSSPAWPQPLRAKEGMPNVLFIVQDDTGFGQMGCYGSPLRTPNIDDLAKNGLLFNNMQTTALCSPTRSCILTREVGRASRAGRPATTGRRPGRRPWALGRLRGMLPDSRRAGCQG